jgi:uracil-DNA glycosylase
VVICGQDPYHTPGVANGLAFDAVGTRTPPSLRNIFKEVIRTYPESKCNIEEWAKQGVLMFNRSMTVDASKPNSHVSDWKPITNKMIQRMNDHWKAHARRVVFLLWGNNAKELKEFIDDTYHLVLTHTHPSPLSRKPFVGNDHFKLCNDHFGQEGFDKIRW